MVLHQKVHQYKYHNTQVSASAFYSDNEESRELILMGKVICFCQKDSKFESHKAKKL